jgi:hypothetical protein
MLTLLRVALFFKTIAAEFQARARTSSDALSFGQSAWSAILSDRDECKCRRGNLLSDFLRSVRRHASTLIRMELRPVAISSA